MEENNMLPEEPVQEPEAVKAPEAPASSVPSIKPALKRAALAFAIIAIVFGVSAIGNMFTAVEWRIVYSGAAKVGGDFVHALKQVPIFGEILVRIFSAGDGAANKAIEAFLKSTTISSAVTGIISGLFGIVFGGLGVTFFTVNAKKGYVAKVVIILSVIGLVFGGIAFLGSVITVAIPFPHIRL